MTANTDSTEESTTERTGEKLLAGATLLVALAVGMAAVGLFAAPAGANATVPCESGDAQGGPTSYNVGDLEVLESDTDTIPVYNDSGTTLTINIQERLESGEINISSVGPAKTYLPEWNETVTCLENVAAGNANISVDPIDPDRNGFTVEGNLTALELRDVVYDPNDGAVDLSYNATGEALNSLTLETSVSDGETVEAIDTSDGSTLDTATVNNGEVTFTGLPDDQRDVRFQSQSAGGGGQVSLSNLVLPDDVGGAQNTTLIGGGDTTVEVDVTNNGASQATVSLELNLVDNSNAVQYSDTVSEQVAAGATETVTFTGVTGFPAGNFDAEVSVVGSNEQVSGGLTGSVDVNGNGEPAAEVTGGPPEFSGMFANVDGTGPDRITIIDVLALFENLPADEVQDNKKFFEFGDPTNQNPDTINILDVVELFERV